eukprot:TRINITY_DN23154_c0_g1_i1.p2 TRINITY_DN23154_c0_g1~~TRINITY_DN23154_c0_g1_i1.p2  ORF type:complete len:115 (+),score=41.78 TRINITY_DN23154_c0_g1_i1:211-555(+)
MGDRKPAEKAELARIIEEGIYTGIDFAAHSNKDLLYLEEHVMPTLVCAVKDLLSELALEVDTPEEKMRRVKVQTIDWIAQYLMRNNPRHNDYLSSHPYTLLINAQARQVRHRMP